MHHPLKTHSYEPQLKVLYFQCTIRWKPYLWLIFRWTTTEGSKISAPSIENLIYGSLMDEPQLKVLPSVYHPLKTPFMTQLLVNPNWIFPKASPSAPCPLLLPKKLYWVLFPVSRPSPCLICFMQLAKVLGPRLLLWALLRCYYY